MAFDLKDYNEVKDRIIELRQKYPDASLQSEVILWPTEALPFIAVKAVCYRSRKDENPGVGLAWEPFPGKTSYTKDSELQNAETSAWGRAIVAALAADTRKGVASADEVRNRRSAGSSRTASPAHEGAGALVPPPASAPSPSSGDDTTIRGGASPEAEGKLENDNKAADSASVAPSDVVDTAEGSVEGEAAGPTAAHVHDWRRAFRLDMAKRGWVICDCGATEKHAA